MSANVQVVNHSGFALDEQAAAALAAEALDLEGSAGSLSLAFVTQEQMSELNLRYRGLSGGTDVLSFPETAAGEEDWPEPDEVDDYLGEVVISPAHAATNAAEDGVSLEEELRRLVVHGVLHILGYDHETDQGEMLALQEAILGRLTATLLLPGQDRDS